MHPALRHTSHRLFPVAPGAWTWRQSWLDLLFAHWPIPAGAIRLLVPPELDVQEFDGTSWIGVVPFHMEGVMRRPLPDLPGISAFPELNLRLYVEHRGTPGVWFLSLDAASRLAVWAARRFFHLPYFHARMAVAVADPEVTYRSVRVAPGHPVAFEAEYAPVSAPFRAVRGSLEHWLTERYCLFAKAPDGRLFRTDVHHEPWPLQPARAAIHRNDLFTPHGLAVSGPPALLHFSRRVDVVVWSPVRL
ncbi:MAG TPA: DUF2071 domain-containing protein [Vicinamibacterales bacterium]|nr:DUF2071 domain-containing protein [Vicinamibacterales bacterium]